MKKNSTYRIEEEQLEQLNQLVQYYQQEQQANSAFNIQLSKANIVELLIKEKYEQLINENKIQKS